MNKAVPEAFTALGPVFGANLSLLSKLNTSNFKMAFKEKYIN